MNKALPKNLKRVSQRFGVLLVYQDVEEVDKVRPMTKG